MNEEDNLYLKADLEDHADLSRIERDEENRLRYSRSDLLEAALDTEVHTTCSGGYQGTYGFVLVMDGLLWVIKDSYGSCSVCDGLLAAHDQDGRPYRVEDPEELDCENVRNYALVMMRNAYAFDNKNDAVRFVHKAEDGDLDVWGWSWGNVSEGIIEDINGVDF